MPNSSDFNRFSVNPVNIDISRSMFNMDHSVKFSCNVGEVIPFDCIEVLPGDTFEIDTSKVIRLQPLVAPIMDEVILDTYWFFVPNRLVWSHWINFMGENTDSPWTPQTEYNIPSLITPPDTGWAVGSIADYLGVPPLMIASNNNNYVSALPFRAYALICDQWFRSEAVMDPVHVHVDDVDRNGVITGDQVTDIELGGKPFIACKFFDYFTACLPAPQRGNPVALPLIDDAAFVNGKLYNPIEFVRTDMEPYTSKSIYKPGNSTTNITGMHTSFRYDGAGNKVIQDFTEQAGTYRLGINQTDAGIAPVVESGTYSGSKVYIDNAFSAIPRSSFASVTVNDLRTAFAIQKYLEKQARFGGRYQEFIKGFFGVDSPDARLQRSEYLGGSRMSLNINQVENNTNATNNETPIGSVAGMSVTADQNSDFTKSFTEHGFIIGCCVVRYHHSYQDSLHKMFIRDTKYEFYNPVFANLGETPVYKKQLYSYSSSTNVFGYQEAWAEYRYLPSRVAGEMRSIYQTPLDMWHLADHYTSAPTLSPEWLREDKSNLDRCLAVTSDVSNQVICDFFVETKATRPMPLYSIPGLIDHH